MSARLLALFVFLLSLPGVVAAQSVLIVYDTASAQTPTLVNTLAGAGNTVTLSATPESTWNGTNPAPTGFSAVIHLNGTTYTSEMPIAGQTALVDYVFAGGGYIHHEWDA